MNHLTSYAAAVRAALKDVPGPVLEDLLEDLDEHLAEVTAETGPDLVATLGPPAVYAEQLRRAAGLTTAPRTLRRDPFVLAFEQARDNDGVRQVLAFLPQLRPAWWVLRGWLLVIALGAVNGSSHVLLPFGVLGLPLIAAAVVVSVRLGTRALSQPTGDGAWRVTVVSNAVLGLVALVVVVGVQQQPGPVYADQSGPPVDASITTRDGSAITNLFPYSSSGEPLSGVLLYDQDGRPVDNLGTYDRNGTQVERVVPTDAPPPPSNAYPQQQRRDGDLSAETPPAAEPVADALLHAGRDRDASTQREPNRPRADADRPERPHRPDRDPAAGRPRGDATHRSGALPQLRPTTPGCLITGGDLTPAEPDVLRSCPQDV